MSKFKSPTAHRYLDEFLGKEKISDKDQERNEAHLLEIGCKKFRLWTKTVEPIKWHERWKIAEVLVNGHISRHEWPFHKTYEPFFNFEVLEDINYLERFANGERVNSRYGVKDDTLMVDGKYLGTERFLNQKFSEMGILVEKKESWII